MSSNTIEQLIKASMANAGVLRPPRSRQGSFTADSPTKDGSGMAFGRFAQESFESGQTAEGRTSATGINASGKRRPSMLRNSVEVSHTDEFSKKMTAIGETGHSSEHPEKKRTSSVESGVRAIPDEMPIAELMHRLGKENNWTEEEVQDDIKTLTKNRIRTAGDVRLTSSEAWKEVRDLLPVVKDRLRTAVSKCT